MFTKRVASFVACVAYDLLKFGVWDCEKSFDALPSIRYYSGGQSLKPVDFKR